MSQLRIAAEFAHDEAMLHCFCATPPIDLHRRTASAITGLPDDAIDGEKRKKAKAINFGLLFGMTPNGLVGHAKSEFGVVLSLPEAQAAHSQFFKLYKGLAAWHANAEEQAPKLRHARTASGRLRHLTNNQKLVRQYLCTPVQGTEADAFKRAIALAYPYLAAIGAYLVNAVHDELVVEAPAAVAEQARMILEWAMKTAMREFLPTVPVEVESHVVDTWLKP